MKSTSAKKGHNSTSFFTQASAYDYLAELMLYSGQYALFYIFMNLSDTMSGFFTDAGHITLLVALLLQTFVATNLSKRPLLKALSTLIAPAIYTAVEIGGDIEWVLNLGHLFFWLYSFALGLMWYLFQKTEALSLKITLESIITFLNISIFIFLYFYFDLKLYARELLEQGAITAYGYKEMLEIYNIHRGFYEFINDPAHIYIIFGGAFLGIIIASERAKILLLNAKISSLMGQYMDKKIRDLVIDGDEKGRKEELVVLFCDIRNFSKISENSPPDKIMETLNLYYEEWNKSVHAHNGVINKFIGDAVLVIFGLEDSLGKAAKSSVACAQEMLEALSDINDTLQKKSLPKIENIGIGIHSGEVTIGGIGGSQRKDFTIIGDNVNVAARLESLTKTLHTDMLISSELYALLDKNQQLFEYRGKWDIKGKINQVEIYSPKK